VGRRPVRNGRCHDGQNETVLSFASYDGTEIGYRVLGDGPPLVCLPGGPGRAAEYLGDLGGLAASRQLVLLDPRGVGLSADPADPASFRVVQPGAAHFPWVDDAAAFAAAVGSFLSRPPGQA
jgi:hypothetical protein